MPLGIKAMQFSTLNEWAANFSFSVLCCLRQLIFNRKGIGYDTLPPTEKIKFSIVQYFCLWAHSVPPSWFGKCTGILGHHPNKRCLRIFLQLDWTMSLGTGEIPEGSCSWAVRPRLMQLFTQSLKVNVWTKQGEKKNRKGGMKSFQVQHSFPFILFMGLTPGHSSL